jgi:hypothetical protein
LEVSKRAVPSVLRRGFGSAQVLLSCLQVTAIAGDGWLAVLLTLLVAAGFVAATVYMWRQVRLCYPEQCSTLLQLTIIG